MKTIVNTVLTQDEVINKTTSMYIDDIYINKNIASSLHVQAKLAAFALICKNPEYLENGIKVLGLKVQQERGKLT